MRVQDGDYVVTQGMTVGLFAGLLAFNGCLVSAQTLYTVFRRSCTG